MAKIIGEDTTNTTPAESENLLELKEWHYFTSAVYSVTHTDFLKDINKISREYVNRTKKGIKLNEIYPVYMGDNMSADPRLSDFTNFIKATASNILMSQGYNMQMLEVIFHELWAQEHYKFSGQEQHIHGGSHITGFYFLDVPDDAPRVVFHDPRSAKVYSNLPESNPAQATYGSTMINFLPIPGTFIFTNSWLPHSFLKNPSVKPFRFIHFNLGVAMKLDTTQPTVV